MMSIVNIDMMPAENIVIDIARICINEIPSGTLIVVLDVELVAVLVMDEFPEVGSMVDVDDVNTLTRTLSETSL